MRLLKDPVFDIAPCSGMTLISSSFCKFKKQADKLATLLIPKNVKMYSTKHIKRVLMWEICLEREEWTHNILIFTNNESKPIIMYRAFNSVEFEIYRQLLHSTVSQIAPVHLRDGCHSLFDLNTKKMLSSSDLKLTNSSCDLQMNYTSFCLLNTGYCAIFTTNDVLWTPNHAVWSDLS